MSTKQKHTPWLLWPFVAIWDLVAWIVGLTGRLVAVIVGAALMIVGAVLIALIITLPLGIPIALIGLLVFLKGLF